MNLKKRLSAMALALIMAASVFAVGASAATFPDVTSYKDAINVLSDIKVIMGYTSGNFKPDTPVLRWHMALWLAKLCTGTVDADEWYKEVAGYPFTDIDSSQYKNSIKYCSDNQIIIGKSATLFKPADSITLQEAVTMIIRALGYPRSQYDSGYPNSYLNKASELGLLDGLSSIGATSEITPTSVITRGQTAQLLYNALYTTRYGSRACWADAVFNMSENYVLTATSNYRLVKTVSYAATGYYRFSKLNANGTLGDSVSVKSSYFSFTDANAMVGASFKMIFKGASAVPAVINQNASRTFKTGLSVNTSAGTITLNNKIYTLSAGGYTYSLVEGIVPSKHELTVYGLNSIYSTSSSSYYVSDGILTASKINGTTGSYSITVYDDNNDGYYDRGVYTPYSFGKLTVDDAGKVAIANGTLASSITLEGYTNAKNGDYILYSFNPQTNVIYVNSILTSLSGTISSYSQLKSTVTIGATTYSLGLDGLLGATPANVMSELPVVPGGTKINFVADGSNILYMEPAGSSSSGGSSGDGSSVSSTSCAVVTKVSYRDNTGMLTSGIKFFIIDVVTQNSTAAKIVAVTLDGEPVSSNSGIAVGDLIEYTVNAEKTAVYGSWEFQGDDETFVPGYIYDVKVLTGTTSYSFTAEHKIYLTTIGNFILYNGDTVVDSMMFNTSSAKWIMYAPGAATPFTTGLLTEKVSAPITIPAGYSIYITVDKTISSAVNYVTLLYIRPTASGSSGSGVTTFDTIVKLDASESTIKTSGGVSTATYTNAVDMFTGATMTVSITYSGAVKITDGYYPVKTSSGSNVLVSTTPINASVSSQQTVYKKNATLTGAGTVSSLYQIEFGKEIFNTQNEMKIYQTVNGKLYPCTYSLFSDLLAAAKASKKPGLNVDVFVKLATNTSPTYASAITIIINN